MTGEKLGGVHRFQCDGCPEAVSTNESDFHAALAEAKAEGFVAVNRSGLWFHYCSSCKRDL